MIGLHEVVIRADVGPGIVMVDGREVRCRQVTVRTEPGSLPELVLTVDACPVSFASDGTAVVSVDGETAAVLVSLGWTPPAQAATCGPEPDAGGASGAGDGDGKAEAAEARLRAVRELAETWAARAPADRTLAQDLATSPHDRVSSDCGREILAIAGEPGPGEATP